MEKLYEYVPAQLVTFLLVTLFSLLIGLSLRRLNLKAGKESQIFGTDRTFTFIGILGYLLYILDPVDYKLYMGGGLILGLLLISYYYARLSQVHAFGATTIVIALITYCIPPIVATQPSWFYVTLVVAVLLFAEMKHTFAELAQRMKNDEMITLAKFLAISGIILPILPRDNLIPGINLTPYTVWFATVIVSGISYLSYLLKRYVFRQSGTFVSGIIGGLYSSTATISVLARKSKSATAEEAPEYVFLRKNHINARADGIVLVNGNSMEPVYHNGDYVYYEEASSADPGEDVIVDTDDGAVIKRVDDDHTLYSVNPAVPYPSKNDQNSLVIRGRVLGVVASSDRPAKEDAGLLEELFVDEIREFNEEHGIRDW